MLTLQIRSLPVKFLLVYFLFGLGSLCAADNGGITETSFVLPQGEWKTVPVEIASAPAGKPIAVLSFHAWLDSPKVAGTAAALQVSLNGIRLMEDLGRAVEFTFMNDGRTFPTYTQKDGWALFYGPSAEVLRGDAEGYKVSDTFDPTAFRLVLDNLPSGKATLEFLNTRLRDDTSEMTIQIEDLKIEYLTEEEARAYENK